LKVCQLLALLDYSIIFLILAFKQQLIINEILIPSYMCVSIEFCMLHSMQIVCENKYENVM